MTKRGWLNIALFIMLMGLAVIAYWRPGLSPADKPADMLTALLPEQIDRIVMQRQGAETIRLRKQSGQWWIESPIKVEANPFRLDALLQLATAKSHGSFVFDTQQAQRYGLDQPLVQVTMNDIDIAFGQTEPLNNRRYVHVKDHVHVIAENYFYQAQLQLSALVNNTLLPPGQLLRSLQLPNLMVRRQTSGWVLEPAQSQLSMDAVNDFMTQWQQASALSISPYANDQAEGLIRLEFEEGQPLEYEILSQDDETILGRRDIGMRFHLSDEQGERLLDGPMVDTEVGVP